MTPFKIDRAINEAQRFIRLAEAAKKRLEENDSFGGTKQTAACRRASMDLTRALADLRRYAP